MKKSFRVENLLILLILITGIGIYVKDKLTKKEPPEELYKKLLKARSVSKEIILKRYREVPDSPNKNSERQKILDECNAKDNEYGKMILQLARKYPQESFVVKAYFRAVEANGGANFSDKLTPKDVANLQKYHRKSKEIKSLISEFTFRGINTKNPELTLALSAFLESIVKDNPDKQIRGIAQFILLKNEIVRFEKEPSSEFEEIKNRVADIENRFNSLIKEYGDCPSINDFPKGETLGDLAKKELFEFQHLRVGLVAPEIQAEDIDGVKFKLSDYRGKVILLDFWGDW